MKDTLLTLTITSMLATTAFADPIHDAAKTGNLAGVQAELDKGVDANEADRSFYNLTPFALGHIQGSRRTPHFRRCGCECDYIGRIDSFAFCSLEWSQGNRRNTYR